MFETTRVHVCGTEDKHLVTCTPYPVQSFNMYRRTIVCKSSEDSKTSAYLNEKVTFFTPLYYDIYVVGT